MDIKSFSEELRGYFNLQADRDHEEAIVSQISNDVSFRGAKLWVLIFAILIASLAPSRDSALQRWPRISPCYSPCYE